MDYLDLFNLNINKVSVIPVHQFLVLWHWLYKVIQTIIKSMPQRCNCLLVNCIEKINVKRKSTDEEKPQLNNTISLELILVHNRQANTLFKWRKINDSGLSTDEPFKRCDYNKKIL